MNHKDIRWKQRYTNLNKAFSQLKAAITKYDDLDDLAREGMVQRFEYTYELAWKTIKDFIEYKGEPESYQRDVIKKAFQLNIIDNGEIWLDMLSKRNLMAHTYNEVTFNEVCNDIRLRFFPQLELLMVFFDNQLTSTNNE